MRVFAIVDWSKTTELEFRVEDGIKGRRFEASAKYIPDDGSPGVETGWSDQGLGDRDQDGDGETTFSESGAALVGGGTSRPGTLTLWLRNPPSEQTGPPVMSGGVPMVATVRVP